MTTATIKEIWRYPVKSMRGERLTGAMLGRNGLQYDRGWAVRDEKDRTIRGAKQFGMLLDCSARYLLDSAPNPVPIAEITLLDGKTMRSDDKQIHRSLSDVVGRKVTLWPIQPADRDEHYRMNAPPADFEAHLRNMFALEPGEPLPDFSAFPPDVLQELLVYASPRGTYFDAFPIHLLTDSSLRFLRKILPESVIDVRRFRPNILITDDQAPAEPIEFGWAGREVALGAARIAAVMRCVRCIMTTRPQRGDSSQPALPHDSAIMRALVRETEQNLGLYATVSKEGPIAVGDAVAVV